jgi:hypothetical protein
VQSRSSSRLVLKRTPSDVLAAAQVALTKVLIYQVEKIRTRMPGLLGSGQRSLREYVAQARHGGLERFGLHRA